jgi:peptide/nickel transport system permease protein
VTLDPTLAVRPTFPSRGRAAFILGASVVAIFVLCAALAPILSRFLGQNPYDEVAPRSVTPPTPPDRLHLLGTDTMGRDQMSRLLYGARVSLEVGLLAQVIALFFGVLVGAVAGYAGGWIDGGLMRLADLLFALPGPLLALAVIAAIPSPDTAPLLRHLPHPSVGVVVLVLGGLGWAGIARLTRGEILRIRGLEYARAAEALGAQGSRVVLRHLLPNALGPLLVAATLGIGSNILMEAWLSFLGVGARPPLPSWGTMITEGQAYFLSKPWVCVAPGLAILTVVLGFNLLGDGVRDLLDPRRHSTA